MDLPNDCVKDFWDRVKTLLKEKGLTQIDLCNNTDILLNTLRIQISRNSQPSIQEIISISDYLNVSIDFLITGKERTKPQFDVEQMRSALQTCLDMLK